MRILSAITTCPRSNGVSYLDGTIRSLTNAGFATEIIHDRMLRGSWPTLRKALERLLMDSGTIRNDDCLIVFQDDIEVAANLAEWVRYNLWPDDYRKIGVCSLYCCQTNIQPTFGWTDLDAIPVWRPHGALSLAFPRRSARILLDDYSNSGFMSGSDTSVASTFRAKGLRNMFHSPGFVEHRGIVSAVCPLGNPINENRRAGRWISDAKTMSVREEVSDAQ